MLRWVFRGRGSGVARRGRFVLRVGRVSSSFVVVAEVKIEVAGSMSFATHESVSWRACAWSISDARSSQRIINMAKGANAHLRQDFSAPEPAH
jgi:hypothetical protein